MIDSFLTFSGWLACVIGILGAIYLFFYKQSELKKISNRQDFAENEKTIRRILIRALVVCMILLISFALISAGNFVKVIKYESRIKSTFDIFDIDGIKRNTGSFELITDGPISAQRPLKVSWIDLGSMTSNQYVERIDVTMKDEFGYGSLWINIPKEKWNFTTGITIDLINNPEYIVRETPFYYNSEGHFSLEFHCIVNMTNDPSNEFQNWYLSLTSSNDIVILSYGEYEAYVDRQIQTAGLIFSFIVISIPVATKTFIELGEKTLQWHKLKK